MVCERIQCIQYSDHDLMANTLTTKTVVRQSVHYMHLHCSLLRDSIPDKLESSHSKKIWEHVNKQQSGSHLQRPNESMFQMR